MALTKRIRRGIVSRGAAVAALGLVAGVVVPVQAASSRADVASGAKDIRVTLITGDRIVVRGGDLAAASVEPVAGREGIGFSTHRTKDHAYWIPADVMGAVGRGRIDRRLFDVAELIRNGYDDASTSTIPVLVTYADAANRAVPSGASVTRQLPSIGGAAMKVDKKKATSFLGRPASVRSLGGFGKVWLDGKREVTLAESVPQIGAPTAWQAGSTGKGVSVAVLDTGIDTSHPDLLPQIAGQQNFTTESKEDLVGHGTHVASTIAGTGAASDGKYKGVAPDAKLYDGKVCEQWGCQDSAILAGMEWAAHEAHADIVNMSLGGTDTPELDPLEEAVNRLTAETGTLFVIAAGNDGPGDRTVASPGSADSALTVGDVTKQDELSFSSSRGPRVGDGAVKPDVSAPGTDIVAAKSKDATIGTPVGDDYLRLSGTSMATPHAAGAAAILLQEHPSWKPDEVKSAIMGSSKAALSQTVFQQGAGRIDVASATKQTVIASQGSLSFGIARFPHTDDQPVTKELVYRNLGQQPETLNLTAAMHGPDGTPAPADALRLSTNTLTVPVGGTALVQVTSATRHDGKDGLYSGRIIATTASRTITVPVGVEKEAEAFNLNVSAIAPDGEAPPFGGRLLLLGIDDDRFDLHFIDETGALTLRLPRGEYLLDHFMEFERAPDDFTFYDLVAPSVHLDSDTTVVLDARKARVVDTSVPNSDAQQAQSDVGYDRNSPDGRGLLAAGPQNFRFGSLFTLSTGPKLPAAELTGHVTSQWGVRGETFPRFKNSPYVYAVADYQPGEFVTGFDRKVRNEDLAIVDHSLNKTTDAPGQIAVAPRLPGVSGVFVRLFVLDTPRTVRYYLDRAPGGWFADVYEFSEDLPFGQWAFHASAKQYQAGRMYHEQWNTVAFGPLARKTGRSGDTMTLLVDSYGDANGHNGGIVLDAAKSTLYRDGREVATAPTFGMASVTGLPAGNSKYSLVSSATQSTSSFSTRVEMTANFRSSASQSSIPIHTVGYRPDVEADNMMTRQRLTRLGLSVSGGPIKKLVIEYSDNNGATWRRAAVTGTEAVFPTPAGTSIALRSTATGAAGSTTIQTVFDAYRMH